MSIPHVYGAALAASISALACAAFAQDAGGDRSDDVHWVLELSIKDGRSDELKPLEEEMSAATQGETGAVSYEWYRDGDTVHLFERFDDSEGAMTHLANFNANFAERFLGLLDVTGWTVYGPASDELMETVGPMGAVNFERVGGFAR